PNLQFAERRHRSIRISDHERQASDLFEAQSRIVGLQFAQGLLIARSELLETIPDKVVLLSVFLGAASFVLQREGLHCNEPATSGESHAQPADDAEAHQLVTKS